MYDKVDEAFIDFINQNRDFIDRMPSDTVEHVTNLGLNCTYILSAPYSVVYVGVYNYGEGCMIVFLDNQFNKVYSYYDVE